MQKNFLIVAAVFFSSQLAAQQDSSSRLLDEVVLTASKYPRKQNETGKVVIVLNAPLLEQLQGYSLGEILGQQAGVTVTGSNNNAGTNQQISIRGASAGNVLVLIDGIPVNDPSILSNYFDLNLFSLSLVERIEILKGGQSTLYGSDAVAGVVNIITKSNSKQPFRAQAGLAGGSYGLFRQHAGISGTKGKTSYGLQYNHEAAKGFSSAYDSTGRQQFDKDGTRQHHLGGNVVFHPSSRMQTKLFGSYNTYTADLDAAAFTDERDYTVHNDNVQAGAGWTYHHQKSLLHVNYHFNYTERRYLDDSSFKSNAYIDYSRSSYIGRTHFAEFYQHTRFEKTELLAGIDYRYNNTKQDYFSTGPFGPYTATPLTAGMHQFSPYISAVFKPSRQLFIEAGSRLNIHSDYGSNVTYTFNPSFLVTPALKIFANIYSAFKAPTLYQLFDPMYGNPSLKPETSGILEAGADAGFQQSFRLRAVGFYRHTTNAIQFIYTDPATYAAAYSNISKQKNYGLEVETFFKKDRWTASANYTFTRGSFTSPYDEAGSKLDGDTTINNLYRVPQHAFQFSIGYQPVKQLNTSLQLHAAGKRLEPVYASKPVTLSPYYTIDFHMSYAFKKLEVFADVKNITNQRYFDLLGYNSKRFNFTTGINISL